MTKTEPREYWISKGTSNFCSKLELDDDLNEVKCRPDGFYDIVSTSDTIEGGIHVTELPPGSIVLSRERFKEAWEKAREAQFENGYYVTCESIEKELFGAG